MNQNPRNIQENGEKRTNKIYEANIIILSKRMKDETKIQTSAQKTKYQVNALSISVLASRTENNICSIA